MNGKTQMIKFNFSPPKGGGEGGGRSKKRRMIDWFPEHLFRKSRKKHGRGWKSGKRVSPTSESPEIFWMRRGFGTCSTVGPVTMMGSSPAGPEGLGEGGRELDTLAATLTFNSINTTFYWSGLWGGGGEGDNQSKLCNISIAVNGRIWFSVD